MKNIITVILCLVASSVSAQEVSFIGWHKDALEANHLSDYKVETKNYRQGPFLSDEDYCEYWNPNGDWRDKSLTLTYDKNDICIGVTNSCVYDDLKQLIQYMNDHFTRIDSRHWKSVDNAFLFTMDIKAALNSVEIETVAMPKAKSVPRKPIVRK